MSTTVTYKGETLTTVNNQTRTLQTAGTYLEDDITLVDVSGGGSAAVYTLGLDERTAVVGADTYWRVKPTINVTTAGSVEAGEVIGTGGSAYPTLAATTITPTRARHHSRKRCHAQHPKSTIIHFVLIGNRILIA